MSESNEERPNPVFLTEESFKGYRDFNASELERLKKLKEHLAGPRGEEIAEAIFNLAKRALEREAACLSWGEFLRKELQDQVQFMTDRARASIREAQARHKKT